MFYFMGELCQLQASSPITSIVNQTYSAITLVLQVTAPIDSPVPYKLKGLGIKGKWYMYLLEFKINPKGLRTFLLS